MSNPIIFLINTVGSLYVMAILLRFLLQLVRADFYNPISQAIVKVTAPPLNILRRIIPGFGGFDVAALVLAFIIQTIFIIIKMQILGYMAFPPGTIAFISVYELIIKVLDIYTFALFIVVIASWVAPGSYNPGLMLLLQLTDPICNKVRNVLPSLGGLDFSVMVVMFGIFFLKSSVLPTLFSYAGLPGF